MSTILMSLVTRDVGKETRLILRYKEKYVRPHVRPAGVSSLNRFHVGHVAQTRGSTLGSCCASVISPSLLLASGLRSASLPAASAAALRAGAPDSLTLAKE